MRKPLQRALILAVGLGILCAFTPNPAQAGPLYRTSTFSRMTHKLWRGLVNIPFCITEIPIEINREVQNLDPFGGTCKGLVYGLYYTGHRFVWAVHDVITFPFNTFGTHYQTKMRSEFPFIDETAD